MTLTGNTIALIATGITTLASNAIAAAVAFGVPLNHTEQVSLLSVIGSLTSVLVLVVGLVVHANVTSTSKAKAAANLPATVTTVHF